MNRRALLGLLSGIGAGTAASFFWRKRDSVMDGDMPDLPIGYEKFSPPLLDVSALGWKDFLNQWDHRARDLILSRAIPRGLGRTADDNAFFIEKLHKAGVVDTDAAFTGWSWPTADGDNQSKRIERIEQLKRGAKELAKLDVLQSLPFVDCSFLVNETMSFPPAAASAIATSEQRLKCTLPDSYKSFAATSNGWLMIDTPLLPIEQIDWYRQKDPESYAGWTSGPPTSPPDETYFVYGPKQNAYNLRTEYFKDLLLISSRGEDNVVDILLNPRVRLDDGEWEAWMLSPHLPGAHRFRSFSSLMEWLYLCEIATFGYFAARTKG